MYVCVCVHTSVRALKIKSVINLNVEITKSEKTKTQR